MSIDRFIRRAAILLGLMLAAPVFAAGGVVSSADPRASEAGQEILRAGGSATDAAMAMMLALTVVEPQSSGIGGGGFLLHHDGKSGLVESIDGRETAPVAVTSTLFLDADGKPNGFRDSVVGGKSVGVPGNVALMARAHAKWGRLPWAALFQPAIRLARDGFLVNAVLARRLEQVAPLWADFPASRALYWRDGKPATEGTLIRNPDLAALLEKIAAEGPDAFYRGDNARALADAVQNAPRNPSPLTMADIAAYRAKDRAPVCGAYRGYRICGMGPPSSGAVTVLQVLGMVERFDLKAGGPLNPQSWHVIAEAMQLAYADRNTYLADRDFVHVPVAGMIDPAYLKARSALIRSDRARGDYPPGTPPGAAPRRMAEPSEVPATSHFVAADGDGNIATMTSTVEGPFGSQMIVNGYVLNNELTDFSFAPEQDGAPVANRVGGGKRPLSSMSPTIVYDASGRPVFALGAAGGKTIIMQVAKAIIARIDWGMTARDALATGTIYFGRGALIIEPGTSLEAVAPGLEALGHKTAKASFPFKANAIAWEGGRWEGAADPRSPGIALTE